MIVNHIKIIALFLEGLLSFLSPCVLPILPVYIGILSGNGGQELDRRGNKQLVFNTLIFILGVATTFFLLAFASSFFSRFLNQNARLVQLIGGILMIVMGLLQLEIIQSKFLGREFSAKSKVYKAGQRVTPLVAFLMGFTFSFSWSPCIGPILASVFFYASSHSGMWSILLISIYCLGFILPFLLVAMFSQTLLSYFKKKSCFLKYSKIISGVILIVIGISIFTGNFKNITQFFK